MVYVKRKENEPVTAMVRRFTRRVQLSGVLLSARKLKFYVSKPTRRLVRERALRRSRTREEREWLDKLGKLPEKRA